MAQLINPVFDVIAEQWVEDPTTDLFEHYETLPQEVQDIIDEFFEENNCYDNCALFVEKLEAVGYTCDYGLDAEPHSLTKL